MTFVGPHQGPNILGKNHQSTTKVTLNEPPKKKMNLGLISQNYNITTNYGIIHLGNWRMDYVVEIKFSFGSLPGGISQPYK